ncbi:alpha/beta hydrolase [Runella salmonicolor]|nr:alpha/beta hydrolase-fold protein [Runella salmonicolor]
MKSLLILSLLSVGTFAQTLPKVSSGSIKRIENFASQYVSARNLDVWLPEGYTPQKKYAVLYMHDGQMLFDSTNNWNKQEWGVDETLAKMMADDKIKATIVVGIWNSDKGRHADYFPQKPYEQLTSLEKQFVVEQLQKAGRTKEVFQPVSDNYLKFLVTELKPLIDKTYATLPDVNNTFVAGSSMGGLISMYAICEYPTVFGGAACLSTHWPGIFSIDNNPIPAAFFKYLNTNLPDYQLHKIYFDYGNQTLDALYPPLQKQVDTILQAKGFTDKNWVTRFFPGDTHSEQAWKKRLPIPIEFLLKK